MSIIIKGMEMPKNCIDCMFTTINYDMCILTKNDLMLCGGRPSWCPIVPLPEGHGRLGDLDKINASLEAMIEIEHNQRAAPCSWSHAYTEMQSILDDAPTIVPAEGGTDECSEN